MKEKRTCPEGHTYYKSSDCPTCPTCEANKKPKEGFFTTLAAPARRALQSKNITSLDQLNDFTEVEIANLHGMGPNAMKKLKAAMAHASVSFKY